LIDRERFNLFKRDGLERGEFRFEVVVLASTSVGSGSHGRPEGRLDAGAFASNGHGDGGAGIFGKVEVNAF
jgi:hypothetical protein